MSETQIQEKHATGATAQVVVLDNVTVGKLKEALDRFTPDVDDRYVYVRNHPQCGITGNIRLSIVDDGGVLLSGGAAHGTC